jgi:hypothetical protein
MQNGQFLLKYPFGVKILPSGEMITLIKIEKCCKKPDRAFDKRK